MKLQYRTVNNMADNGQQDGPSAACRQGIPCSTTLGSFWDIILQGTIIFSASSFTGQKGSA